MRQDCYLVQLSQWHGSLKLKIRAHGDGGDGGEAHGVVHDVQCDVVHDAVRGAEYVIQVLALESDGKCKPHYDCSSMSEWVSDSVIQ